MQRMKLFHLAFSLALLLSTTVSPAIGYPITPKTLWDLAGQADLIVIAEVVLVNEVPELTVDLEDIGAPSASYLSGGGHVSRLRVIEHLKGKGPQTLMVQFSRNMICPAPARYETGKTVLAFLRRAEGSIKTLGLSYGTLYPASHEIPLFRARIKEALALQSSTFAISEHVDWLVRAASHSATRWHGLYPLSSSSDRLHSYYDRANRDGDKINLLTTDHLISLAEGFAKDPGIDRTFPMMLSVLARFPSQKFDEATVAGIEALIRDETLPWWIRDVLPLVIERFSHGVPHKDLELPGESWDSVDSKTFKAIWNKAKIRLDIPDIKPAPIRKELVWGVGKNTPS